MTTRRTFLTTSALAATAALGTPWRLSATRWPRLESLESPQRRKHSMSVDDPDLQALARRALDAATAAGASYADIRFTHTHRRHFPTLDEQQSVAVGLRALVQGAWGFLATTELTPERMDWLGHTAGRLAKASAWPNVPAITLGERPPVATGRWETPVARDPWTVPTAEYQDLIEKLNSAALALKATASLKFNINRQERTFASTDGAFTTQTIHTIFGPGGDGSSLLVYAAGTSGRGGIVQVPLVSPRGGGIEVVTQEHLLEHLPEWVQVAQQAADADPLESPGRFDVVFDGYAMAALVNSLGAALEVDRALDTTSVGRTSYLAPIETVLGTPQFPGAVTLTGNRMMPGGAATVQWDDEGVAAQTFPLVKAGQLVDYATSREFVAGMTAGYRARGQLVQSRGCAGSASAFSLPVVQTPNLELAPGAKDVSFEEMVAGLEDGLAVVGGNLQADAQQLNVLGGQGALVYRVKRGKFVGAILDARYTMRTPELWKNLVALGGARSAVTRGFTTGKGAPEQVTTHSVRAVAARFKNVFIRTSGE